MASAQRRKHRACLGRNAHGQDRVVAQSLASPHSSSRSSSLSRRHGVVSRHRRIVSKRVAKDSFPRILAAGCGRVLRVRFDRVSVRVTRRRDCACAFPTSSNGSQLCMHKIDECTRAAYRRGSYPRAFASQPRLGCPINRAHAAAEPADSSRTRHRGRWSTTTAVIIAAKSGCSTRAIPQNRRAR